ncbi:phage portal protein [Bacillaceae bacterium SIJ1]|uniref:phage portal protein n=1 Tax=Litoribacterium kuwaitense TaxID=1398745 RepID=UPI0013EBE05B|nr:phage portal protein [Litoribacterium kuwaitense]NGP45980.1 phage portal protein [Litoribacterium kuwaitense]
MYRLDIEEPTVEVIKKLIDEYDDSTAEKLQNYYDGNQDILKRKFEDDSKPNNKIVTNFCKYITNVSVGNFIGVPVSYSSEDEDYMQQLQDIFNFNNEQQVNATLARTASIRSKAFEIVYTTTDDSGQLQIRFAELDQEEQNVIIVYDRSIEKK